MTPTSPAHQESFDEGQVVGLRTYLLILQETSYPFYPTFYFALVRTFLGHHFQLTFAAPDYPVNCSRCSYAGLDDLSVSWDRVVSN